MVLFFPHFQIFLFVTPIDRSPESQQHPVAASDFERTIKKSDVSVFLYSAVRIYLPGAWPMIGLPSGLAQHVSQFCVAL